MRYGKTEFEMTGRYIPTLSEVSEKGRWQEMGLKDYEIEFLSERKHITKKRSTFDENTDTVYREANIEDES